MRLIDADKLKQHYAWWNDENKELFDTIVDMQPTVEPDASVKAKRGLRWTGKRQPKEDQYPAQMKLRYEKRLRKEDEGKCQK